MQDCDYYIDPEEDEVFFGCVNDKEKMISSNVTNNSASSKWTSIFKRQSDHLKNTENTEDCGEENKSLRLKNMGDNLDNAEGKVGKGSAKTNFMDDTSFPRVRTNVDSDDEYSSLPSNNTSIELDHNYSYTNQKIDKSILSTPKSVVKADKDGGFLKVLSEIALVKAEADNKIEEDAVEDGSIIFIDKKEYEENKENEAYSVPDIKITEPTPEKVCKILSQSPNSNVQSRKYKTIHNSPQIIDKVGQKQVKSKSFSENLGYNKNVKNLWNINGSSCQSPLKVNDDENTPDDKKKSRGNSWPNTKEVLNESNNLIQLAVDNFNANQQAVTCEEKEEQIIELEDSNEKMEDAKDHLLETEATEEVGDFLIFTPAKTVKSIENKKEEIIASKMIAFSPMLKVEKSTINIIPNNEPNKLDLLTGEADTAPTELHIPEEKDEKQLEEYLQENLTAIKSLEIESREPPTNMSVNNIELGLKNKLPPKYRFSKEAKQIVEALKTSVDDTLNFTIPEINLEEMENSFISPPAITGLDDTVIENKNIVQQSVAAMTPVNKFHLLKQCKSAEKLLHNQSPAMPETKIQAYKYFSERKIQPSLSSDVKKCNRRLPISGKALVTGTKNIQSCEKKISAIPTSRIPVCGIKPSKIPPSCISAQSGCLKTTPFKGVTNVRTELSKTPGSSASKNSKFKNVASPISAYIHNKQTALVINVKPQVRKDGVLKVFKTEVNSSAKKTPVPPVTPSKDLGLPFVEYKSATPYKVEKPSQSRLPRLAPTVQKLIGTNSPRILKHKGRFYMKTPLGKDASNNETILADRNEVSVVVSQIAQKTNSIK